MSTRIRTAGLMIASISLLSLSACEDKSASSRAEMKAEIYRVNGDLSKAMLSTAPPSTPEFEESLATLQNIINDAAAIKGENDGLKATKSLLLSHALAELSTLNMAQAQAIESQNHHEAAELVALVEAWIDLQNMITSRETFDLSPNMAELQDARQSVESSLSVLHEQIAELNGPIRTRITQNSRDNEEASQLRRQSDQLYREAREKGYEAGFNAFEQAVQIKRRADRIELDIAQREIELDLNLQAEHDYISLNVQHLGTTIESIANAEFALDTFAQSGKQDNDTTRRTISELQDKLTANLQVLNQRIENELNPVYETASQNLEKASSEAQAAARKLDKSSKGAATLAAACAQESLGRLYWNKARGIENIAFVYQLMGEAGGDLAGNDVYDRIETLLAAQEDVIAQAITAYNQASQLLGQVNDRENQNVINTFRESIQRAIVALDGEVDEEAMNASAADAGTSDNTRTASNSNSNDPFATPDGLIRYLREALDNGDPSKQVERTHAESRLGVRMLRASSSMSDIIDDFVTAMTDKLGDAAAVPMLEGIKQGLSFGTSLPDLDSGTIIEQTADRIVYRTSNFGIANTFALIRVDGSWFVDGDYMGNSNEAQFEQGIEVMEKMNKTLSDMVTKIENGEITSMDEIMAEMMKSIPSFSGG